MPRCDSDGIDARQSGAREKFQSSAQILPPGEYTAY